MNRFIFIGAPGVGKGTFAKLICKSQKWAHFSLGDMLRAEVASKSKLGLSISEKMSQGLLISDEIANEVIKNSIAKANGYVLDGYPRTVPQAEFLESITKNDLFAVNITMEKEIAIEKLLSRRTCATCGDGFNIANIVKEGYDMPALLPDKNKCNFGVLCNPVFETRNDDNREVIERRFEEYSRKTEPLLDFYGKRNRLINFTVKKGIKDTDAVLAQMLSFKVFAERNDPNHTRDVIESLLKNGSPKTLEILCLIVREIGVAALHGSAACSYAASLPINKTVTPNNSASKKPQVSPTYQKTHHLSPTLEGLSRLGTVPLPKVIDYVEDVSDSEDDSASDIPSQSSESSDDEHNSEDDAEEEWKEILPQQDLQTPQKNSSAHKQQTHQDFFKTLVKDVENPTAQKWKSPDSSFVAGAAGGSATKSSIITPDKHVVVVEEPEEVHHQVHLPHSHLLSSTATPGLEEQIEIAIRSALTVTENFSLTTHLSASDDASARYFSAELLDEISRSVIYHIGLTGEFADKCEGRITDTLLIFVGYHVNTDNCDLLCAVIKSVIEKQLDKYQFELDGAEEVAAEADEDGDQEQVDQLSEAVHRVESHGTSGSPKAHHNNPADLILREHERHLDELDDTNVFRYIQRTASHHLEMNEPNPMTPSAATNARSVDSAGLPREGEFNEELDTEIYEGSDSSSDDEVQDDSEDSQSNGTPRNEEEEGGDEDGTSPSRGGPIKGESVPAWLLPKSPLDAVFKKGYGGLGHPDLSDVVARIAATPDKPMRAYNDSSSGSDGEEDDDVKEVRDLDRYVGGEDGSSSDEADDDDAAESSEPEEEHPALTIDDLPQRLGDLTVSEQKNLHDAMRAYLRRQAYAVPDDENDDDDILASDPDEDSESIDRGDEADEEDDDDDGVEEIEFDDSAVDDSEIETEDDSQLARDEEEVNEIIRRYMKNNEEAKKLRAKNAALDAEDDEYVIEDYEEADEDEEDEEQSRDGLNDDDDSTDAVMDLLNDSISSNQLLSFGLPAGNRASDSESSGGSRPKIYPSEQSQPKDQSASHHSSGITSEVVDEKKFLLDKLRALSRSRLTRSPPKVIRKTVDKVAAPSGASPAKNKLASPSKSSPTKSPRKQQQQQAAAEAELVGPTSDDHLHPSNHQSTSLQYNADGTLKLTGSSALNDVMLEALRKTSEKFNAETSAKQQKLDQIKRTVDAQKAQQQRLAGNAVNGTSPTRLSAKRTAASTAAPQSPVRESPNEYTIEQLDAIIKTNLARLEALKSPLAKVPPRSPGGTLINNLSHVQPSVFQFADQLNMSQEHIISGAISKSWDSPRKTNSSEGGARPVSRKSRSHPGLASRSSEDPFPPPASAGAAVSGSGEKKKKHIEVNLSPSGTFGTSSVANTTTTSAAVVFPVKPVKHHQSHGTGSGKKPMTRSQSGDILLSMDSSIDSDEVDLELPAKTTKKQRSSAGPQTTPQQKRLTRRMSNGSNHHVNRPASKERGGSASKGARGSLLAPTVAATMRSLAVAGNSSDAKIKQQSKLIHKSVVHEDSKPSSARKKKSTK